MTDETKADNLAAHVDDWHNEDDYFKDPVDAVEDASGSSSLKDVALIIAGEQVELRRIIQLLIVTGKVEPETVREARDLARMLE